MLLDKIAKVKDINQSLAEAKKMKSKSNDAGALARYTQSEVPKICNDLIASQIINHTFPKAIAVPKLHAWESRLNALIPVIHSDSIKEVSALLNEIHSEVSKYKEHWETYSHSYSKEIAKFLSVLNLVFNKPEYIQLQKQIENFETLWPISQANIHHFLSKIEEARTIIDSLKVTETVKSALGKIAAGNATLNDLTDEVMAWVKSNQLSGNLRISVIG